MTSKRTEDVIDVFFDEIENDTYQHSSSNDFQEKVKKTINDSLNSEGFKNLTELFNDGISTFKKTFLEDGQPIFQYDIERVNTRLDYVKKELNTVKFDIFKRGQYKEGYVEALLLYVDRMEMAKHNLLRMEQEMKRDLQKKRWKNVKRSERYYEGYEAGMEFLKELLHHSKVYMMDKINKELYTLPNHD